MHPMTEGDEALLWTIPWEGTQAEALLLNRLNPLYIEVCRRIRLRCGPDGDLYGVRATSGAARIVGKEAKG